jgi:hypothetical protein
MRVYIFGIILLCNTLAACKSGSVDLALGTPNIVAKAMEFHGNEMFQSAALSMTITSLSGSFRIESSRENGRFEYIVTDPRSQRRVLLNNEIVQEWRNGTEIPLDEEEKRRARAFVDARVFFPLLPFTLNGTDVHFEDFGLDHWNGQDLQKVKVSFTPGSSNDADDSYMFWFDPDTGRVEQFGYDFSGGLRYRKAVEFNRVGGILFSNQENYAVDGGRVPVEMLSPEYVEEHMVLLSTVVLSEVSVEQF